MSIDSIVEEVRQVREAYAKKFNYDVHAMWRDIKKRQQKVACKESHYRPSV